MISALPRRRRSLAWLLLIVALAVGLAWLASVPLLRSSRTVASANGWANRRLSSP